MKKKTLLFSLLLSTLVCSTTFAQNNDFDLASQRNESQNVLKVPGHKIVNAEVVINPTPHHIQLDKQNLLTLDNGVNLKGVKQEFLKDLSFLVENKKGPKLELLFGDKNAKKNNVKEVSGAYNLTISKKGIQITGYDERGVFYGIQTLKQLLNSPIASDGTLPYLEIKDYPDLPLRGVVEGFYGTPWSHEVRLSLIDLYGDYKMNTYIYGPKDDPYHSAPNWRLPYPENEAENIKDLINACNENYVDFVWAIHPGQDIKWNEEDYNNLLNKFQMMYDLGVRSFAIFFDDISGEGTNPNKQTELLNRLNTDFVKVKGDVSSLIVCPTDYTKLWANPTPQGSLVTYGNTLDEGIEVFWTGDAVCSDLTKSTMDWVNSRIKRPAFYWWNYPVTDYVRHIIMQGPVYGLETTLTANDVSGVVSNPMEHGEASKLALYGVADYTWNMADYNPLGNWERAFEVLTPEVKDAYRTFAIHSADTETGYRRDESWETETFRLDEYNKAKADKLYKEFDKVEKVEATMDANCDNKLLMKELKPWLQEFTKLGKRGKKTIELMNIYNTSNNSDFWSAYLENTMSPEEVEAYKAHRSGTMKLQPFYENAMDDMLEGFYTRISSKLPSSYKAVGTFKNLYTPQSKMMFDKDSTTFYTSGIAQKTGNWIGVDLGELTDVYEVSILQGRNSVDDVDYFDSAILEFSEDGKTWTPMTDVLEKTYVIEWENKPIKARYIRLRKLESEKRNWVAIRSFEVNNKAIDRLGFKISNDSNAENIIAAFDGDPTTSYSNKGTLSFEVPESVVGYTILQTSPVNVQIKQYNKRGKLIQESTSSNSYLELNLNKDTKRVELIGDTEIAEIIPMK